MFKSIANLAADRLLPGRRRFRALLRSCDLVPQLVDDSSAPEEPGDFILCGAPRSGTSLAAAMLFQPPHVVTVMEPWDGLRLPPDQLFGSLRREIESGRLIRGRLDAAALDNDGSVRWGRDREFEYRVSVAEDYVLGVKWPTYWQYLDRLTATKFVVCLRHPDEVIRSCAGKRGRLERGLDYDVPFNMELNDDLLRATNSDERRRQLLYDRIYERVEPHLSRPEVFPIRYERWFRDPSSLVGELSEFLGVPLHANRAVIKRSKSGHIEPPDLCLSAIGRRLGY